MGAPAIFEKQIEIKLLHSASTLESRIQVIMRLFTRAVSKSPFQTDTSLCSVLNKTCIKKAPPDVHRETQLLAMAPPLPRAGTKRWTFGGLLEEWATAFENDT
ncbi:MAG: hypothetical protein P8X79_13160 [Reinekea sp.]